MWRRPALALVLVATAGAVVFAVVDDNEPTGRRYGDLTMMGGGGLDPRATATPSDFPDETNTGVPEGTNLTAYSGSNPVTVNNTVIDGKLIVGGITINASGVTIKNSRITGDGGYAVYCEDHNTCGQGASPLLIQDSEIDCTNNNAGGAVAGAGTAIGEANYTLLRVDISGCENGGDVNDDVTCQDSYIHDLWEDPTVGVDGTHTDGFQFGGGHYEGSAGTVTPGAKDVTITHCTIFGYGPKADGSDPRLGTSAIITNRGPTNIDENILVDGNLMVGGTTIYCEQDGATAINERVINNHFTTRYGEFDLPAIPDISASCSDESDISGNVIHETGEPVELD